VNHKKKKFFFSVNYGPQMITFNTSLDSEKKPYQTEPKKTTWAHFKKKSCRSLAIEDNTKKIYFTAVL
jgi:hypothetical protein